MEVIKMEFHEKLQELRKSRGLTQEELAEALYVSRAAVSKWESGRGYPSIDSLKEISGYFSVTIDDLLSGEKLIFLAEKENKSNLRSICELFFGIVDLCAFMLIVLPLYPNSVNDHIYSVNLFAYNQAEPLKRMICWTLFLVLGMLGVIKLLVRKSENRKWHQWITNFSMILGIFIVLFLGLAREAYAVTMAFLLLAIKVIIMMKSMKI